MAQLNPTVGAIKANTQKIIDTIKAQQSTHDLIIFPELAITGYPPQDLLFRTELYTQTAEALTQIQRHTHNCYVIVGHPWIDNHLRYNAASIIHEQSVITRYYKQKLPNYGVFDEARYFTPGQANACVFSIKSYRIGICICEDLWHKTSMAPIIQNNPDLLICLNASPFEMTKYKQRESLIRQYARQGLTGLYVNQTGGQDELLFDGQSFAINSEGNLIARSPAFKEHFETIRLTANRSDGNITPLLEKNALIYEGLVCGVKDYVEKNNFRGVLLGLSGGIDSALTLAIAVDALGAERVHAVMMPSRYTASISSEDASEMLHALNVKQYTTVSIEPAFKTLLTTLSPSFAELPPDITEENLQARIRGLLLMALSNKTGYMVLNTSNKSETAVGYSTLYGDMVGGLAVLKDVFKTQVYELAHYRNTVSPVIPERTLLRPPSAELSENQLDQNTLPPYELLDAILIRYIEQGLSADEIIAEGYEKSIVMHLLKRVTQNEYKRQQSAPGIKISTCAFGLDWRYPITSGFIK